MRLKKLQEKVKEQQEKVGEKVCPHCYSVITGCNVRTGAVLLGLGSLNDMPFYAEY